MSRGDGVREPVFATDPVSEELAELQFTLGEGPSVDALARDDAVLVADLETPGNARRWPSFASAAAVRGIRGVFSIPIRVGAARLGILDLYRSRAGPLTGAELADVLAYADAILVLALDQLGGINPSFEEFLDAEFTERRAGVHQAAGMVSVQLGVGMTDALARLRAYAYASDRRLADVSSDVVGRRLWFHPDTGVAIEADGDRRLGDLTAQDQNDGRDTGLRPDGDPTDTEGVR
jgi:hypothetical protein